MSAPDIKTRINAARDAAMEVCWQIEGCGASKSLTEASIKASALLTILTDLVNDVSVSVK
jgi:hypothetical protein